MARNRKTKRHSKKAGLAPGTLVHIGERKLETARITVIDFDENSFQEEQVNSVEECFQFKTTPTVSWINIDGLHNISIIEKIGKHFDIHPLILEDILSTGQRPKFEDMEKHIFVVLKMMRFDDPSQTCVTLARLVHPGP